MISHCGYAQGVPINAAEVSKCHFTKVRGTSHFFPQQFTVGSNTTQQPRQDFEIKLEDAVNSSQERQERRFDSDHVSHSWSLILPSLLMEGNYDNPAALARGVGD